MPDDILISELSNAPQIDDSAVFPLTQDNGGSPATFKATMSQIAGKIGEGTTFANLQTTSKTLVGALNELKAGGGGSADITTEIDTPSAIQTFSDGGNNIPMKSCEVAIVAQQASGTPSPSTPLPITGFSSVALSVSDGVTPTTTNVSLGQTIYGGTAELVGGNGTKAFGYVDLGDLSWNYAGGTFRAIVSDAIAPISGGDTTAICEIYNRVGYSSSIADLSFYLCANQLSASKYLVIRDDSYNENAAAFKTGVTGKKLVYTLGTPTAFTFTGATIPTLSGVNNVYADSGDVNELEYFNDKADEIAELINIYPYEVSGVLMAGQTSITLSSGLIKADSTIDVYTSDGTNYNSVSVSSGSVTIAFDEQQADLGVKVRIS